MTSFNYLMLRGRLTELGNEDVPLIADTKNAEFTDHKGILRSSHDKEDANLKNLKV